MDSTEVPPAVPVPDPGGATPASAAAVAKRSPYRSVLRLKNFRRLWVGMTISSLGDWIGLFALISVTNRLAPGNTLAIAGLMIFRVLPAFLVGPLAGVALDRVDRRKAMVACDITRAVLIASIPFATTLPWLYAISFLLETIALVWMPAKDALVPQLVPNRWLVAANSLALLTTYGVIPIGAFVFTGLVGVSEFVGTHVSGLQVLEFNQENLALWIDTATFLASALLVSRIDFPGLPRAKSSVRLSVLWDEVLEGLRYLKEKGEVARVMRGIAVALVGGAVIFSLGAPFVTQVLSGGAKGFGLLVSLAGTGMGAGLLALAFVGDRLPKSWVFAVSVLAFGVGLILASVISQLWVALVLVTVFGSFAGMAYATGFALIQERVDDRVRGRTFAALQIVIRLSIFGSLVAFPALARLLTTIGVVGSIKEAIRLSMALAGLTVIAAGTITARDVQSGRISP